MIVRFGVEIILLLYCWHKLSGSSSLEVSLEGLLETQICEELSFKRTWGQILTHTNLEMLCVKVNEHLLQDSCISYSD